MNAVLTLKREVCQNTYEFVFDLSEPLSFQAGQYVFLTLPSLEKNDPRGPRRHFSITSAPEQNRQIIITSRIRDTGFKQTLVKLPIGMHVDIRGPYGELLLPEDELQSVVFIAGGIGITPFMSMLQHMKNIGRQTPVILLYSNKNRETSAFLEELCELSKVMPNFTFYPTMTGDPNWNGDTGRIDAAYIQKRVSELKSSIFYVVGPEGLNQAMEDVLVSLNVDLDNIKREDFTGY